jgi:hypothetical protein
VVVQKQLHNLAPSSWETEKGDAMTCLNVLAFCGSLDQVAKRFHKQLEAMYKRIFFDETPNSAPVPSLGARASGSSSLSNLPNTVDPDDDLYSPDEVSPDYLLYIPENAHSSRVNLSLSLLSMLSKPFGDVKSKESPEDHSLKEHWLLDPSRYEYPQMVERLDWDIESTGMFQWDFDKLHGSSFETEQTSAEGQGSSSSRDIDGASGQNRLLGSMEPSSWSSAAHVMKRLRRS